MPKQQLDSGTAPARTDVRPPQTPSLLPSWMTTTAPAPEVPSWVQPSTPVQGDDPFSAMMASASGANVSPVRTITLGENAQSLNPVTSEAVEQQEREQARDLAVQQLGLKNDPEKVYRMTDDEYLALTPKQRAAIDFNTALVSAVRQDKRSQEKYGRSVDKGSGVVAITSETAVDAEQQRKYQSDLESMFGKGRDSEYYAPATVALLKDIGYSNELSDLDDFLNLETAITDKDLKNFKGNPGMELPELPDLKGVKEQTTTGYQMSDQVLNDPMWQMQNELTTGMSARIQEVLAKGDLLLGTTFKTLANARAGQVGEYGGLVPQLKALPGYAAGDPRTGYKTGDTETNPFDLAFEQLTSNKDWLNPESLGSLNMALEQKGVKPDLFWTYANQRITDAELAGGTLGSVGYQPDELRKLLGLKPAGG